MENSVDIGRLLAGIGNNPALLGALSELLGKSGDDRPRSAAAPADNLRSEAGGGAFSYNSTRNDIGESPRQVSSYRGGENVESGSADIMSILSSLLSPSINSGGERHEGTGERSGGDNPMKKLLGGKEDSENRIRLLNALRPYLGEERRGKLDVMLKLLRVAELGQLSGLIESLGS